MPSPTPVPATAALPTRDELQAAAAIVHAAMPPTPQRVWPLLCEAVGTEVWVKHENHAPTGAFKVRGGLVYLDALRRERGTVAGLVTATRGNHGQSIAFAARAAGIPVLVVVPHGNSVEKNAAMRAFGAEVVAEGHDFQASVEAADRIAAERGWLRIPSFHPLLVRGVGTYALELLQAAPALDVAYVPVGLGSGICGMLAARDALGLRTEVVGVVSRHAPAYALSLARGELVSHPVTTVLADGMACRTPLADALAHMRAGGVRLVQVDDAEVAHAMRVLFSTTHNVAEGAGAASLAAALQERDQLRGRTVGVVVSGSNVDRDVYAAVLRDA